MRPLSPAMRRSARERSNEPPSSLVRELFSVCGRMNAPLSPSARTGSRLDSVRESTKLLLLMNRGRSQELSLGVSETAEVSDRSRSTPTGTPRRNRRSLYASRPIGSESGYTRRSRVLARSLLKESIPSGCQVRPAALRQRCVSASVGTSAASSLRATGKRKAVASA